MTTVAILPVPTDKGITYQGTAGDKHSRGRTLGEALDALTPQLPDADAGMLVVVQSLHPDRFFGAIEQQRLGELMLAWRLARDLGSALPDQEQAELDQLIDAELYASANRAALLADQAGR